MNDQGLAPGFRDAPAAAFRGEATTAAAAVVPPRRPRIDITHSPDLAVTDLGRLRRQVRLNRALAKGTFVPAEDEGGALERVVGRNNMLPFYVLELGSRLGQAVCIIKCPDRSGTGFLVGKDLLLTNNHVLETVELARDAWCYFGFQLGLDRKLHEGVPFRLEPEKLFVTSRHDDGPDPNLYGLDYTLVRIDKAAAEQFGSIRLSRGALGVIRDEKANIIHHPKGQAKHVTLQENNVTEDDGIYLRYESDSESGSSGSPVFNNDWQLIALHHRWRPKADGGFHNEGVKLSAIAADLERRSQETGPDRVAAAEALALFQDTDSLLGGYFGALGRRSRPHVSPLERVVDLYEGEADDIDVGFWNVEWFTRTWAQKLDPVARLVVDLNLDVYALAESSPESARRLADHLRRHYGLDLAVAASEPDAPEGRQTTTVLWNTKTVRGGRHEWPDDVRPWFEVDSRQLASASASTEAVHGKVFDRHPGLFRFEALGRDGRRPFDFFLVPLHLKAMAEGRLRRRMAAQILGAAIRKMIDTGMDADWVVGGDYNAELATGDFKALFQEGMVPISAEDEKDGAMTYLKSPKSLIDHIFLSPNLAKVYNAEDFFIYAADARTPDYVKEISDHRPVLARLSLAAVGGGAEAAPAGLPPGLAEMLGRFGPG